MSLYQEIILAAFLREMDCRKQSQFYEPINKPNVIFRQTLRVE
jgi:hypothetical protein